MKKFIKITLSCLLTVLLFTVAQPSVDAASVSVKAKSGQVKVGSTVDFIVAVSQNGVTSGSITVSTSKELSVVETEWLVSNPIMKDFNGNNGVFAFSSKNNINGNYFRIRVKANSIVQAATVTVSVQLKNGENIVLNQSASGTVRVICSKHSFSERRVEPTCDTNGSITRTCSVCGIVEKTTIAAFGHKVSETTITKQPTCLEDGLAVGTCDVCHKEVTSVILATGHKFGEWEVIEQSTCEIHGTEERICPVCEYKETREAKLREHQLGSDATVIQENTLSQSGIISGTCSICGQEVMIVTECKAIDESNGILVSCQEGTFVEGSVFVAERIDPSSVDYSRCANAISQFSDKFTLFDIHAELNGYQVQPNGTVKLEFVIPSELSEKVILVHIDDEGRLEIINCTVDAYQRIVTANVEHFSNYALVEVSQTVIQQVQVIEENGIWPIVTISLGIVALGLLCVVIFMPKSHTKTKTKKTKTKSKKDNSNSFDFK